MLNAWNRAKRADNPEVMFVRIEAGEGMKKIITLRDAHG